jgi:glycogen debranching enzyme
MIKNSLMGRDLQSLFANMSPARKAMIVPALALKSVTSRGGKSVYASSDTLFKGAVFGRDSLEVAEDLMRIKPKLVKNILVRLAELQGIVNNKENEEEPGKIIHEYRNVILDGKRIGKSSKRIFDELSAKWGGNDNELAYYASVDATPHFLRVLGLYCSLYGDSFLNYIVKQRNGNTVTMRQAANAATNWLTNKLASSKSGLVEYKRANPHSIKNQVWKDSEEFYVHTNKQLANHKKPIASIEVQALAYDALTAASRIFPDLSMTLLGQAYNLRDRTIQLLWQKDKHYFALGIDYDADDNIRIIQTATANPGALLDSGFFDWLDHDDREKYIQGIVKKVMGKNFLTSAGIRSRSLAAAHLIKIWDYHGSYVSWPKETYDIAKGMHRQGFPKLGRQLENRLLNIVLKTGEYPEFVYVDEWGRVLTQKRPKKQTHGELILVRGTNTPERIQAWTVSAVMAILSERLDKKFSKKNSKSQSPWQKELEATILSHIPNINRYINPLKLLIRYPTHKYKLSE